MHWQEEIGSRFHLTATQVGALEHLLEILSVQRDRNLTAVTGAESIVRVHFLDSLCLLDIPELQGATSAVDIGSGAGFPGLPLAIARPDLNISMVEANRKKTEFLMAVVNELGLGNVIVMPIRAEDLGQSRYRQSFDVALARAVGSLSEVLEYSLPLLKIGGHAILQRGSREDGDERTAVAAARSLGGILDRIEKATPYPEAKNLHVWIFQKTAATPSRYPRRAGIPRKRPINS